MGGRKYARLLTYFAIFIMSVINATVRFSFKMYSKEDFGKISSIHSRTFEENSVEA